MTAHATKQKTTHHPKVHHLTKQISWVSESALNKMDKALKKLEVEQKEYTKHVEAYVHNNPYKSLGIAAVAGAFLALLLRK